MDAFVDASQAHAPAWLGDLFHAIDAKDAVRFVGFLTDDATFRFGSAEAVCGREGIRAAVDGFFSSIAALEHDVARVWHGDDTYVCEGEVTYTRHDGSRIALPFVDVFVMREQRIEQYLIYMDIAPLYAGAA